MTLSVGPPKGEGHARSPSPVPHTDKEGGKEGAGSGAPSTRRLSLFYSP
jgi:hypothetical protein